MIVMRRIVIRIMVKRVIMTNDLHYYHGDREQLYTDDGNGVDYNRLW